MCFYCVVVVEMKKRAKKKCEHEPCATYSYDSNPSRDKVLELICGKCGVELVAKWTEKKKGKKI